MTSQEADLAMTAFNQAFYVKEGDCGYFRKNTASHECADFWKFAEEIEMVEDVCERSGKPECKQQLAELVRGFRRQYGDDWKNNVYNDDIMWMCIASVRAWNITGDGGCRALAKTNFDACFARAWDTNFMGGGMWWTTGCSNKNSCVNAPAAIAACLLARACGEPAYTNKANHIIDWMKSVLSDGHGRIYDSIRINGRRAYFSLTYNQGTYIGACHLLGRVEDAKAAADYTMNVMGYETNGVRILPQYRMTGDGAGFNGIFLRWMTRFMEDRNLRASYFPWLQANATAAWNARRRSDNLSWNRWLQETPANGTVLESWCCSPSVVASQLVPGSP